MLIKNNNKKLLWERSLFSKERPFDNIKKFSSTKLLKLAKEELSDNQIEIPSLIRSEFGYRKDKKSSQELKKLFADHKKKPIFWLQKARQELSKLKLEQKGHHYVYAILLDYTDLYPPYGIYIGESQYHPEQRYINHLKGEKFVSSKVVFDRGCEILYSCFQHLARPTKKDCYHKKLESQMAEILKKSDKCSESGLPKRRIKGGR